MFEQHILVSSVFLSGLVSFLSPCIFPIIPIYFSILAKNGKKTLNTLLFIFGLSLTFISLGFSFGLLGNLLFNDTTRIIAGIIVIILGVQQLGIFKIGLLERTKLIEIKTDNRNSAIQSLVLGLTFSLGWTPCIGPILATVLTLSGDEGTALYGAGMMLVYVLGLSTPFVLFSFLSENILKITKKLNNHLNKFKIIGGILIIFMGFLLMTNKFDLFI
ncbi:cytochrome c biogenesis protein CcdA [Caviibacterium pharyngocola]|uniref:Cytochrome C biogenesis protein n=1 Tax=Caviibacterium pharyngocola TaxID=28159 RepID=A0A2M8RYW3_9PAST|nr:cytochrome c biogenesis protein CcdA [Caviibacterium pharyngocola]PJG84080.1 cytochrome C biogenesis protein [Caviibacterium pharyngocola]